MQNAWFMAAAWMCLAFITLPIFTLLRNTETLRQIGGGGIAGNPAERINCPGGCSPREDDEFLRSRLNDGRHAINWPPGDVLCCS
jgi:hypothetical protein